MTAALTMTLRDGRQFAWAEYGDPGGRPVLLLHGTPGSRLQAAGADEPARHAGVRLVAPDRAGSGLSDPASDLSFTSYSSDLAALLDHLALPTVALVGVSGGGGYALAAAATIPARVSEVTLVCAMIPDPPRATTTTRMRQVGLAFALARRAPRLAEKLIAKQTRLVAAASPKTLDRLTRGMPGPDQAVLRDPDLRALTTADAAEAVRQGTRAAVHELGLYGGRAGFDYRDVTTPVRIVHGRQDRNVPLPVASWLQAQLPDARLEVIEDAGHLFALRQPDLLLGTMP